MGLSLTLALFAGGLFLLWVGLTGKPVLPTLTSLVTTGKVPT